jgi:hypothetical protein
MKEASAASKKLQNWLNGKSDEDDEKDADEGDKLEIDFETKVYKTRAFEGHAEKDRMQAAADYSDRWFVSKGASFNVFYICLAGGATPCCTLIEAKAWDTLWTDPLHTKQRWYCKQCRAKYKTKFGVLVEIVCDLRGFYCKAELPPVDLMDAKWMKVQEDYKQYDTPEALLDALPTVKPIAAERLFKKTPYEGHFAFDKHTLDELEVLDWSQLYNLRKQ